MGKVENNLKTRKEQEDEEETDDVGGDVGGGSAACGSDGSRGRYHLDLHRQRRGGGRWRFVWFASGFRFDYRRDNNTVNSGRLSCDEHRVLCVLRLQRADVNGDGVLTKADAQLLTKLKNGTGKWNVDQLKTGDFNGNGKLDNADYQALRDLLKERGVL